jgi:hypothetical protein
MKGEVCIIQIESEPAPHGLFSKNLTSHPGKYGWLKNGWGMSSLRLGRLGIPPIL